MFFSKITFVILLCATPVVYFAQPVPKDKRVRYIEKKGHTIKITGTTNLSDLKPLRNILNKKRIVLLGEFTHGSREINLLKNRVIAYLHEKMGFNVLLLESGMGEAYQLQFMRGDRTSRQMLSGLTGPWQSLEYLQLIDYLKTRNQLQIGGFDVQRTGRSFSQILDSLSNLKSESLEDRFSTLSAKFQDRKNTDTLALSKEKDDLVNDYLELYREIDAEKKTLEANGWNSQKLELIKRTLKNRIAYLKYFLQFKQDGDFHKRWAARDTAMAENVIWFAEEMFPGEKIIVSAHNFHLAKQNEKELVMGEILKQKFGDELYSIGIFGGRGTHANNSRKPEALIESGEENDIQTVINRSKNEATFLDFAAKNSKNSAWLFQNITVNNSFIDLESGNKLALQKWFDGMILIKNISPPEYPQ